MWQWCDNQPFDLIPNSDLESPIEFCVEPKTWHLHLHFGSWSCAGTLTYHNGEDFDPHRRTGWARISACARSSAAFARHGCRSSGLRLRHNAAEESRNKQLWDGLWQITILSATVKIRNLFHVDSKLRYSVLFDSQSQIFKTREKETEVSKKCKQPTRASPTW